jgi:4-diphosphocytidyl-2-C-methyl-D-erythritol kinase
LTVKVVSVKAFAKVNLTLRVLGRREDGYHTLRTVFQSLALHDTLTFHEAAGPFRIGCDDPECPTDRTNLVWRAAETVWEAAGRRGRPRDVAVRIAKRIPVQSGMGGGSSDAAAAIRGLAALWRLDLSLERRQGIAARLGADVPFFLDGGTALGIGRGDVLFPLIDQPPAWVTLAIPSFGVSTREAYLWFDQASGPAIVPRRSARRPAVRDATPSSHRGLPGPGPDQPLAWLGRLPESERRNDLEEPVARRHPEIARLSDSLQTHGAVYAAMSGSGSAVFGLFLLRSAADAARRVLARCGFRTLVTRVLDRRRFEKLSRPRFTQNL